MAEIPIFPLRTVLFPGGQLPLRIFEQRYLDMVKHCSRNNSGFGVCFLVDTEEDNSRIRSARVGTLARIVDWYTMEDGLLGLTAEGTVRFVLGDDRHDDSGLMMGEVSWLTVVSPDDVDGPELVLEPNAAYPAMKALKEALFEDGIPFTAFEVDDIDAEHERLRDLGVRFTQSPVESAGVKYAVLDDTCGNLIQIYQQVD